MVRVELLVFLATMSSALAMVSKRADETDLVLEVLVVFDERSRAKWDKMARQAGNSYREEVYSMFAEINTIYKPLGIEIRFKNNDLYLVAEDILPESQLYNGDWIDADYALETFFHWLEEQDVEYDVAMMMAGYNLADGEEEGVGGIAFQWDACTTRGAIVIELTFDMRQAIAMAHEMAHTLGSPHDGEDNSCNGDDGYIMTALTAYDQVNFMKWSECTAEAIKSFLERDDKQCLTDTKEGESITGQRFGQLVGGDETCRRRLGASSYVSRMMENNHVCVAVRCQSLHEVIFNDEAHRWREGVTDFFSPAGMPCGPGKSCEGGECVENADVPADVDDACLFGDVPFFYDAPWYSCWRAMDDDICHAGNFVKMCCDSCKRS